MIGPWSRAIRASPGTLSINRVGVDQRIPTALLGRIIEKLNTDRQESDLSTTGTRITWLQFKVELSCDWIRALKGRPAFYLVCLTLLTAGGLVPLLLLTRQLFLPFLVRLISHRNRSVPHTTGNRNPARISCRVGTGAPIF